MQLLGHFALGYFSALAVSRITKEKFIIPIAWLISILPDADLLFRQYLNHRGPTHSLVIVAIAFLPLLLFFRRGLPYLASLASHSLIGDYVNLSVQFLWPLSAKWYGIEPSLQLMDTKLMIVELLLFTLMIITIIYLGKKIPKIND